MKLKSFLKSHWGPLSVLFLFLIVKLLWYRFGGFQWDEAVYLNMAKFLYSSGTMGFFEILRPILLPLLIGSVWKLGIGVFVAGKILAVFISLALLVLVYVTSKNLFDKKIALVAMILLAITPIFLEQCFRIMPTLWAIACVLLALYSIKEERYILAGIFSGLGFLFRFTQGAVIIAVGLALLIELFRNRDFKSFVAKSLKYYVAFVLTVIPYFLFNYFMYIKETDYLYHALFRPFIYASGTIAISGGENNPLFFLANMLFQNYLSIFVLVALVVLVMKKQYFKPEISALVFIFLIQFVYFSRLDHQEIRYLLDFLVYGLIIASYGIFVLYSIIRKKRVVNYVILCLILLLLIFALFWRPDIYGECDGGFAGVLGDVNGTILATTPFAAVELDNKFEHNFYSLPVAVKDYRTRDDIEAFVLYTKQFEMSDENKEIYRELILNDNLVAAETICLHDYLFFIKSGKGVDFEQRAEIMDSLGIEYDTLSVSQNPLDSFIVVLLVEDAGAVDLDEAKGNFWKADNFLRTNEILSGIKVNWNVVPYQLTLLDEETEEYLKQYFGEENVNIIQKGYSYEDNGKLSEFFGLSYDEQLSKITRGKDQLKDFYGVEVKTFVPPFNKADKITLKALEDLGFSAYVTGIGDPAAFEETSLKVYKDQLYTIDWTKSRMKSASEILSELDYYLKYANFVFIPLYYPYMQEQDFGSLSQILEILAREGAVYFTPNELLEWQEFRQNVNVEIDGNKIIVDAPNEDGRLTVTVKRSGDYIVEGVEVFKIKNAADSTINITVNGRNLKLEPGEIV